ncbi:class I SAM-dependent methyltransferase [Abyssalbus ytuae]|uniref:Class I SAM-dependent methyltransferase n=1 Tax=Abyssalbus ytuae TaxID=2926907 RepID=A0A9E7A3R1_9FLAO|nr:class I SAM-dependent methyltransferase [Abyssalbus ytuae]UOB19326.1 class I SAM-dependent methyltransferase [Abyssalbus ytuae]
MEIKEKVFLKCKDYLVSQETFSLIEDEENNMLITYPKPAIENLDKYYQSENYISHTDSKKGLLNKLYQFIKYFALKNKVRLINKHAKGKKDLLDIGAGTGSFLKVAQKKGWNTYGVEPNQYARSLAEKRNIKLNENIDNIHKTFDVITMWHVLEHVYDLDTYILKLNQLLNENGILIIAVPNFESYDAQHYKNYWAAYDVPRHLWHFSKSSIKKLFNKQNLKVVKIVPMLFDSFYVSLLSEKYKTGKMNFIKAFFIGLKSNFKAKSNLNYSSLIYILKK